MDDSLAMSSLADALKLVYVYAEKESPKCRQITPRFSGRECRRRCWADTLGGRERPQLSQSHAAKLSAMIARISKIHLTGADALAWRSTCRLEGLVPGCTARN
jgi:hypothetical protein